MGKLETQDLHPVIGDDFELLVARLHGHVHDMATADRVHGEADRINAVGGMAVTLFNFIDDVDHNTSRQAMVGTESIQDYAQEGREAARKFVAEATGNVLAVDEVPVAPKQKGIFGRLLDRFLAD